MQNDLFSDDIYLVQQTKQLEIEKEVADFQRRLEQVLSEQELKDLAWILSKVPLRTLAENGNKFISILNYNIVWTKD